jgi:hypothetical protein
MRQRSSDHLDECLRCTRRKHTSVGAIPWRTTPTHHRSAMCELRDQVRRAEGPLPETGRLPSANCHAGSGRNTEEAESRVVANGLSGTRGSPRSTREPRTDRLGDSRQVRSYSKPNRSRAGRARRTRQEIAGIPTIARNSSVVFVTGNGSLGTSRPSRSQMGSHPSAGDHSSKRSPGTLCRTASLCRS